MRFPVSFTQRRLWFLDQLSPGEATYNMPFGMWLSGPLDVAALQRALDRLVERHAVLRTAIVATNGVPEQDVADTGTIPIAHLALPDDLSGDARTRRAEELADELAGQPFDLSVAPLMRATLIDVEPDRCLFVLVMHHIISDGESMKILIDELSAFYREQVTGTPAELPTLWMGYGDYAVWQDDVIRGEELERQLGYWRDHLRGAPPLLDLPTDHPRPARQSSAGGVSLVLLDTDTTRRLAGLAQAVNATPFMVVLAAFAAVLSRYARQSDVVIGTQTAGRTHTELEPILGLFTNTVALRMSLSGEPTFAQFVAQVRDTTLDAMAHQQLPFEKLVEDLAPERTLAYSPLIQVQFVYGSLTPPIPDLPGITATSRALLNETTKLDLTVYADVADNDRTALSMEFSTDLFTEEWAHRFLTAMRHLLEAASTAPDTPVADLPLLSPADEKALTSGYASSKAHVPSHADPSPRADGSSNADSEPAGRGLSNADTGSAGDVPTAAEIDRLDVRVMLRASSSRVMDGDAGTTMRDVCERAARIARTLAERGVGADTLVGLCTGRGTGMLAGLLGVWWAGGAYVPLDPDFPAARLAAMARGAGLRLVLSDADHAELAGSLADGVEVIRIDDPAVAAAEPLPPVPVPADALAYVIFTSGSTGRPKGVAIPHRAVRNLLTSFRNRIGLTAADRFVAVTTLSFDIALLELLLPPVVGADLVIATGEQSREPDGLRALIASQGATAMQATPQTWRLLDTAGGVPDRLRLRLCGGEALPSDLAARLIGPGVTLWNVYGPTETTVWSAAGVVTAATTAGRIGPAIDHTRVYVLDDRLAPVPVGVIGEVCLGGLGVARGYHDQPRLTARGFRPDPWGAPGERLYRTGDLGRWRAPGELELIGRNDHQVKLRGYRIECGEIETVLRAHRDVRQAAVVIANRGGEPALVAYIVPRRGGAVADPGTDLLAHLRPHLSATLPDYMIPALVVALTALPLTPNGKVDRAALPAPQWGTTSTSDGIVEPRNPVEATLARIWADLLTIERPIGAYDNLFALGGHSLTATRFVARVADTYHISLPVHRVFAGPTIAELAEAITSDPDYASGDTDPAPAPRVALDGLSDQELDDLLQAAIAQRNRRQSLGGTAGT